MQIYIGEGNQVRWDDLRDEETGTPLLAATVTAVIKDASSVVVGFSATLAHNGDGNYVGTLSKATCSLLTNGTNYNLELTAVQTGYEDGFRRIPFTAMYHREQ